MIAAITAGVPAGAATTSGYHGGTAMKLVDLNGFWTMTDLDSGRRFSARVPGTVAATLLEQQAMPDPYWRENEGAVQPLFAVDYEFSREFDIEPGALAHDQVLLHCDGLDTVAELAVNGAAAGRADNMHRTWVFDVKPLLRPGRNLLSITLRSPVRYLGEHPAKLGARFSVLRKAACMFGWNWGPVLPDSGIWRDIYLESRDGAHLEHVIVRQRHRDGHVGLLVQPRCSVSSGDVQARIEVRAPSGEVLYSRLHPAEGDTAAEITIEQPELWWPAGYGSQPRYTVTTALRQGDTELDRRDLRVGLRTIELDRSADGDGSRYRFIINGTRIFFRGDSLVIDDSITARSDAAHWTRLVDNCLRASVNGIRVWGGAYYPPDTFYELCDERGLLVYQDCMYASSFYATSAEFLDNSRQELIDNLSRIAHRPCIALYCGNNEIDLTYTVTGSTDPQTVGLRDILHGTALDDGTRAYLWKQYTELFLTMIPGICQEYAPDASYVHSSPSLREPGGAQAFADYFSGGDTHYYLPYDGNAPYQKMRTFRSRFMSETGFESFPAMKTIRTFSESSDDNPFSAVMRAHQKRENGNEVIDLYLRRDYLVPTDFEDYVLLSQLQAAEIMKYTVEHLRRDNEYCSGVIIWQANDCWPVISCSGYDYEGRWKALQYYKKRFFAPVLISARDEDARVELWVSNERREQFTGDVEWQLEDSSGSALRSGRLPVTAAAGQSLACADLDFTDLLTADNRDRVHLGYRLLSGATEVSAGTVLFMLPKDGHFERPQIELDVQDLGDRYEILVTAGSFAKNVVLDTRVGDCVFSDNWIDVSPGRPRPVTVPKADAVGIESAEVLRQHLIVRSLNDIMIDAAESAEAGERTSEAGG
jgi:beta-mannosidase